MLSSPTRNCLFSAVSFVVSRLYKRTKKIFVLPTIHSSYYFIILKNRSQDIDFMWGGCMLFRAKELKTDSLGILSAWKNGGYSDDLTVAATCVQQNTKIRCPSHAIFPQWLDDGVTLKQYWNYLRRQLYVLDTYATPSNRRTNHIMAAFHIYASLAFVVPAATAVLRLMVLMATVVILPTQRVYSSVGSESYNWLDALLPLDHPGCKASMVSWLAYMTSLVYMAVALRWLTNVVLALFIELDPALKRRQMATFNWAKLWCAFYIYNLVLPFCMVYTFATKHIDWAGIRYYRSKGKVVRVEHSFKTR